MTLRTVFAPLLRALTGGRYPSRPAARKTEASPLGREWSNLLFELQLSPQVFQEVLATGSLHPHFHYHHFNRPKKHGGRREICEPDTKLKRVQREIITRLFLLEFPHPAAVAYRKKKSIAYHVWPHAGAEVLITADVQDFFPSTSPGRVEDWWRGRVNDAQARLLTLLTTYRGGLPQGAPTSPGLSNFLNRGLDEKLARRAATAGAIYTRYCDDMVFSWRHGSGPPSDFENGVRATLHEFGYALHPKKGWQVHQRSDEPEITGLILTRHGDVRVSDEVRQAMAVLARSRDPRDTQRLAGYRGYEPWVRNAPAVDSEKNERASGLARGPPFLPAN